MKKTVKYTVKQVCEIIGVDLPKEYEYMANDVISFMTHKPALIKEGAVLFLFGTSNEQRTSMVKQAMENHVKIVFHGPASSSLPILEEVPHIEVTKSGDAFAKVAASIRRDLDLRVVAVTGSLGKTTTKEIVTSVLKQKYVTAKSPGNNNTAYSISGNLQKILLDTEVLVQECGVGITGVSMSRNAEVCCPDVALITNISDPHLDIFGTRENILKEKLDLVLATPKGNPAFLNYDDELLKNVKLADHPVISFAVHNKQADYYAENVKVYDEYMTFDIVHKGESTPVTLYAQGEHNIGNALAAMAVGEYFDIPVKQIVKGIASFRSEGIRQSLTNIGGYQLYIDCYNTAPISLLGSVDVLSKIPIEKGGKRIAVLGDIVRLGDQAEKLHVETGTKIGESGKLDLVLCFGNEYAKMLADSIRAKGTAALYTSDREVLNEWIRGLVTKKDIVLFKGPVARLLSKSIDQVYGTCYHISSEHFERKERDGYQVSVVYEKEDYNKRVAALLKYSNKEEDVTTPEIIANTPVFCVARKCFFQNNELKHVKISEPVSNIGEAAFRSCENLESVSLPKTLIGISDKAFSRCPSLKEIDIPEGVIDIGEYAFSRCKKLTTVKIPASVGHIGERAFFEDKKVKIVCPENSYAQEYAVKHQIPYEICK